MHMFKTDQPAYKIGSGTGYLSEGQPLGRGTGYHRVGHWVAGRDGTVPDTPCVLQDKWVNLSVGLVPTAYDPQ